MNYVDPLSEDIRMVGGRLVDVTEMDQDEIDAAQDQYEESRERYQDD